MGSKYWAERVGKVKIKIASAAYQPRLFEKGRLLLSVRSSSLVPAAAPGDSGAEVSAPPQSSFHKAIPVASGPAQNFSQLVQAAFLDVCLTPPARIPVLRVMGHLCFDSVRRIHSGEVEVTYGVGPHHFLTAAPAAPPRRPAHWELGNQGVVPVALIAHVPTIPPSGQSTLGFLGGTTRPWRAGQPVSNGLGDRGSRVDLHETELPVHVGLQEPVLTC